ncbi:MAG: trehalose-binding protein [Rhodospirillaceae bacterium]|nr:MAG: trehalose-binding protein [Rhodospirillaceae bacterium]
MNNSDNNKNRVAPEQIEPNRIFIKDLQAFSGLVMRRFGQDQCMRIAAALSYTMLLALVPLGTIVFAILRAFPVFDDIQGQIKSLLFENFLPESVDGVGQYFDQFISQTEGLTAVGTLALAVTAIMLLSTIEVALNKIFRVTTKRAFVPRLLMFWAVLTVGPLLLGGSLSLGTYLLVVTSFVEGEVFSGFGGVVTKLMPTVLAIGAFSVFYAIVPNKHVRLRDALIGGLTAGVLFGVVRTLFALYITTFPAYQTIYGALSTLPIFLIWMYVSWAIVLIGAQVSASLSQWGRPRFEDCFEHLSPARQLETCMAALENLWRKSRHQDDVNPNRSVARADELEEALEVLREKGFADQSDHGDWLLVRDVETVTILELAYGLGLTPDPDDLVSPGRRKWQDDLQQALTNQDSTHMARTLRQLFERSA